MKRPRWITLTTDFGRSDSYVAEMKGVILREHPDAHLIDITHEIPPQDRISGSLVLRRSYRYFPKGTIHLIVVDPGVGTSRKLLIGKAKQYLFLAPDNGLLSPLLAEEPMTFYALSQTRVSSTSSSATFEGRDLLAPAAAKLLRGIPPQKLGRPVRSIVKLSEWDVTFSSRSLRGKILAKDHFGNLITNIRQKDFVKFQAQKKDKPVWVKAGKIIFRGIAHTYAEGQKKPIALFGSAGLLELAVRNGNASHRLSLKQGSHIDLVYGTS